MNWAWERDWEWGQVRRGVMLYAGVLLVVLGLGGARLALCAPSAETVRIATITSPLHEEMSNQILAILIPQPGQAPGNWDTVFAQAPAVNDDLLARSEQAARAGAKIIFWSEAMAVVPQEEEAVLIARGQELARREQIYLGMSLWTFLRRDLDPLPPEPATVNKVVLIEPSGAVAWEYRKAIPVPGAEEAITVKGDGVVRMLDTPYGRIGVVICFDADFPALLRPAGRSGVDILFIPGADWEAITPDHTQMAFFRGLENGFSVVRAAQNGLTAAADYQGRTLAWMDHFHTQDRTLFAHVPTRGTRTAYTMIGDLFAWLCLAGFVALVGWAILRRNAA